MQAVLNGLTQDLFLVVAPRVRIGAAATKREQVHHLDARARGVPQHSIRR